MYGMQATVICDDQNRITHFSSLYPGSVHDSRAFKASSIGKSEACFSNKHQYLLADSAYGITNRIISPFKKRRGTHETLSKDKKRFNRNLSHLRIKIEHTIGILKHRFRSLRKLPVRIINTHDIKWVLEWIGSCVILHNLLITTDVWEPTQEELQVVLQDEMNREDSEEHEIEVQAVHAGRV
jgi:hypothetical protein